MLTQRLAAFRPSSSPDAIYIRRLFRIALLSAFISAAVLIYIFYTSVITITNATMTLEDGMTFRTGIPTTRPSDEKRLLTVYDGSFQYSWWMRPQLEVGFDDCLESIEINGQKVAPYYYSHQDLCNWWEPVTVQIGTYVQQGENRVRFQVRDKFVAGGTTSIDVNSMFMPGRQALYSWVSVVCAGNLVLYFLLVFLWYRRISGQKSPIAFLRSYQIFPRETLGKLAIMLAIPPLLMWKWQLLPHESGDYRNFLSHWLRFIREQGLSKAYGSEFTDYAPLYTYLLGISQALLPEGARDLLVIKAINMVFEVIMAYYAYRIVELLRSPGSLMKYVAFIGVLASPGTNINGVMVGQADVTFTTMLVAMIYYLMRSEPLKAMVAQGLAFALKLQGLYCMPVVIGMALARRIPIGYLLLVPAIYMWLALPCIMQGRPVLETLMVYFGQYSKYHDLGNLPNLHYWTPERYFIPFFITGQLLGLMVASLIIASIAIKPALQRGENLLVMCVFCTTILPYVLPKMLDRYFLAATCLTWILAFVNSRYWLGALLLALGYSFSDVNFTYHFYGSLNQKIQLHYIGWFINTAAVLVISCQALRVMIKAPARLEP